MQDNQSQDAKPQEPQSQHGQSQENQQKSILDEPTSDAVKQRNKPSGAHYIEPSPLGIEPVEQTGVDQATNPQRSNEHPAQTAEVPLGTGTHDEPPGAGGRQSS